MCESVKYYLGTRWKVEVVCIISIQDGRLK